jgi:Fe-only nitrogenase accessory protein AnfO
MKIATFANKDGQAVSLYENGFLRLYERASGLWVKQKEQALSLSREMGLGEVRCRIREALEALGECKVFIAADVKGVPYAILEGLGFNIWKSEGPLLDQLDYVAQKEEEAIAAAKRPKPQPQPVGDLRDGYYRVNLTEMQNADSSVSSQQILIPFLEKTTFDKLEILCDHPPRWLGREFERLNLRFEAEALDAHGHEVRIMVYPK